MDRSKIIARAGMLQTGSMIVFCLAALVGVFAIIQGRYDLAVVNGVLMLANFALYQMQSTIIRANLPQRH
jgi:hypothetical protein